MDVKLRKAVRDRAEQYCEYCQRAEEPAAYVWFQIEHIVPRKHGGMDHLDNLALACPECNLHKGTNLTGLDPQTPLITPLFNPRRDLWDDHFAWHGLRIVGLTAIGRTTVQVLQLNSVARLDRRVASRI